ncbi:MAG: hypothetical protein JWN50_187 [Parcubacteria group bacterium]|nr:hypothetical protein [Parcubacteria group bacterium]
MMHNYYPGYAMGYEPFHFFGGVLNVVFWVLIILLIIRFARRRKGGDWHGFMHRHHHSPIEILKERYAKGEINKEEFEEKKRDLM